MRIDVAIGGIMNLILALSDRNVDVIVSIISTALVPFIVQYLRAKAAEAASSAAREKLEKRKVLSERVKGFLYGTAANIAENRFPALARQVLNKEITNSDDVKEELYRWGGDLKQSAIEYFEREDLDLAIEIGEATLMNWITRAANHVSPFPGLESSKVMLVDQVSDMLVHKGVDWMRTHVFALLDGKKIE